MMLGIRISKTTKIVDAQNSPFLTILSAIIESVNPIIANPI